MNPNIHHLLKHRLVPVFYHPDAQWCTLVFQTCYQQGIRVFEFTNRGENALETFAQLGKLQAATGADMLLGAGTIFSKKEAADFMAAGAAFIVSPCFVSEVAAVCNERGIPYLPGCMTVKEIFDASRQGCGMVKVFPASVAGTAFVKAVKAVLPHIKLMATGGISEKNMGEWLAAGTDAVGASALQMVPAGKEEQLVTQIQLLLQALR